MANREHVKRLLAGVEVWNQWRAESPLVVPDLRGVDLRSTDLRGVALWGCALWGADLRGAVLQGATLQGGDFTKVNFQGADLRRAVLQGAILRETKLQGTNLQEADFTNADFTNADFTKAKLQGTNLQRANLSGAVLQEAILRETKLQGTNLQRTNLQRADFQRASLRMTYLVKADLLKANFKEANLTGANLTGANLTGTDLTGANLTGTDLTGANLQATNFNQVIVGLGILDFRRSTGTGLLNAKPTLFASIDLRHVQGLETVQHRGPSTIGIDTLYLSGGNIPESFLRGCGVPNSMIDYAHALVAAERAIDYYSCFISYSSHDEALAQRLYADLQAKGVRCWFAPHDLKIGESILGSIDQGIRLHDKLLLLLSESSVNSKWVEREVQLALNREIHESRRILFPVRIDDAVLTSDAPWAALIRADHHIGDFCAWKEHDAYRAVFERLLRDLRAGDVMRT